ncbi:MAG: Helix-turn-helix domain [Bacteroidota bacterium]
MKPKKEHLGQKIKRLRAFRGMTQQELAHAIGKTRSLVSFFERTGNINQYSLLEICSVLKITPEDLETSTQVDEGKGPDYAPSPKNLELLEQLKEENKFLKETINNQWQLLKELSKGK